MNPDARLQGTPRTAVSRRAYHRGTFEFAEKIGERRMPDPWTAEKMLELAHLHARLEEERELDPLMETLVAEPVYEFHPMAMTLSGGERIRRYYAQFFEAFMPRIVGHSLIAESASEQIVTQEYDIVVDVDGQHETHRVVGVLYARGALLAGERLYGSDRVMRLFLGDLYAECVPLER